MFTSHYNVIIFSSSVYVCTGVYARVSLWVYVHVVLCVLLLIWILKSNTLPFDCYIKKNITVRPCVTVSHVHERHLSNKHIHSFRTDRIAQTITHCHFMLPFTRAILSSSSTLSKVVCVCTHAYKEELLVIILEAKRFCKQYFLPHYPNSPPLFTVNHLHLKEKKKGRYFNKRIVFKEKATSDSFSIHYFFTL